MTQKEFIEILDEKRYSYEIEGDKIIVTHKWNILLSSLTSLPHGVVFKNSGSVNLESLTYLPPGVEFRNGGSVDLASLTSLPPDVEFNNEGTVFLGSLTSLPPGVEFKNEGDVSLSDLTFGGLYGWKGIIGGIDSKRLLNVMIKQGVFI